MSTINKFKAYILRMNQSGMKYSSTTAAMLHLQGIALTVFIILATFKCGRAMLRDEPKLRPGNHKHWSNRSSRSPAAGGSRPWLDCGCATLFDLLPWLEHIKFNIMPVHAGAKGQVGAVPKVINYVKSRAGRRRALGLGVQESKAGLRIRGVAHVCTIIACRLANSKL